MGISMQEAIEVFRDLLRDQLTDPLTGRASKNKAWIYDDVAKVDLSQYPRIMITPGAENDELAGVGSFDTWDTFRINIEIIVRKSDKIAIDSYDPATPEQLVDVLGKQTKLLIKNNHPLFITHNMTARYEMVNTTYPLPNDANPRITKRITIKVNTRN